MSKIFNELVWNNMPNIIKENGEVAVIRVLDDKSFDEALNNKLLEE